MTTIDWRSLWRFLDYSGDQFSAVQSVTLRAQFAGMSNNPVMPTLSPGGTDFTSVKKKSRGRGSARDDMEMESEPGEGTTFSFEIHNLEADSPEDPKDEEKPVGPNAVAA